MTQIDRFGTVVQITASAGDVIDLDAELENAGPSGVPISSLGSDSADLYFRITGGGGGSVRDVQYVPHGADPGTPTALKLGGSGTITRQQIGQLGSLKCWTAANVRVQAMIRDGGNE